MNTNNFPYTDVQNIKGQEGEKILFTLNDYQKLASRTDNDKEPLNMRLANYGLGIGGESGEVSDIIKKHVFHSHSLTREDLAKELGDVLWYVAMIAKLADFTLEEIATINIDKLNKRYKNGFSKEASKNRTV